MKEISSIYWPEEFSYEAKALLECLIAYCVDFAYGYDLEEEMINNICNFLDDNCVDYEVTERDDIE